MVTLEMVLERENVQQAIEHLLSKKNACGDDGVWLHDLAEYWEWNEKNITGQLRKGTTAAVQCAADFISEGRGYVVELDVLNFFDNIVHEKLLTILNRFITDKPLLLLLEQYVICKVEYDCAVQVKNKGLVQGNAISPLLSNLYLTEFDEWMERQEYAFVRFADNIIRCRFMLMKNKGYNMPRQWIWHPYIIFAAI